MEIGGRLLLAAILGGFIGLERESQGRPAGLRTHMLVSLGSCLIMLISVYGFAGKGMVYDPGRLAAQVISGIGFLGAGTILRDGISVRGLTTAASLWLVAGVGLAIGAGFYIGAAVTTLFAAITLIALEHIEKRYIYSKSMLIETLVINSPGELGNLCKVLGDLNINIRHIDLEVIEDKGQANLAFVIDNKNYPKSTIVEKLQQIPGVLRVRCK